MFFRATLFIRLNETYLPKFHKAKEDVVSCVYKNYEHVLSIYSLSKISLQVIEQLHLIFIHFHLKFPINLVIS